MRIVFLSFYLAVFLSAASLSGCGIKPSAVDPPDSVDKDYFPHTYPDPANDPDPQRYIRK